MRLVNELLKLCAAVVIYGCIFIGQAYAADVVKKPDIQADREMLERMFIGSSQVIIGHFDLENTGDVKNPEPDEPVKINFLIDYHLKGVAPSINTIEIPVPYRLFMMRTKEGVDNHVTMMTASRHQRDVKNHAYKNGAISKTEWLVIDAEYSKDSLSYRHEIDFYRAIKRGLDMSFKPDIKYVLFLGNDFDSDYINWEIQIAYRMFSRGSGTFADLLFEEVE